MNSEFKFLVFSDLHAHNYKSFNKSGNRLDNCLKVPELLFDKSEEHGVDDILFAGDLYDTHEIIYSKVVTGMLSTFGKLFTKYPKKKFYAISGNHDQDGKNLANKPAGTSLTHLADVFPNNFILIDNKQVIINGVTVYGIPYYEYEKDFSEMLGKASECILHETPNDAQYQHILLIHQTPAGIFNKFIPTETDPSDHRYEVFDKVFCGHIHSRQEITDDFIIVGSPLHRDKGDVGEDKGYYLVSNDLHTSYCSLQGYFPSYMVVNEDEVDDITDTNPEILKDNYVIYVPKVTSGIDVGDEDTGVEYDKFNTGLSDVNILTNYIEEVATEGLPEDLLEVGLSFLN